MLSSVWFGGLSTADMFLELVLIMGCYLEKYHAHVGTWAARTVWCAQGSNINGQVRSYLANLCLCAVVLKKLNELEVKEEYQIEITNKFAALENLNADEDINRASENIKENIKTSAKESLGLHELKWHKPWFDKECLGFLDQRK